MIEEGELQPLHPAIRKVWQWSGVLTWLIIGLVASVPEFFIRRANDYPMIPWIALVVCLGFAVIGWVLADRQYRSWRYALRTNDLVLEHGIFWRQVRCVARDRVQHLDINSGPLDRRFGLVQVSIYVAGSAGTVGSIPGLTAERAEELRVAILEGRSENA